MRSWTFTFAICAILVLGCQRSVTVSNPDGVATGIGQFWIAPTLIVRWAAPLAYLVLAAAALVAWRRSRTTSLWVLGLAATSGLLGTVGSVAAYAPMRGATIDEIGSGEAIPIAWLFNFAQSLIAAGYLLAIIGGLVALRGVIQSQSTGNDAEQG